jgi:hypothetical protein
MSNKLIFLIYTSTEVCTTAAANAWLAPFEIPFELYLKFRLLACLSPIHVAHPYPTCLSGSLLAGVGLEQF